MNFWITQIIGLLGLLFIIISFQKDKKSFTLINHIFGSLSFVIHFILLNAWTGAAVNIVSAGRAYVFHIKESNKLLNKRIIMYLFILFFWIAGYLTWQSYLSLLPVISLTITSFALWSKKTKHMRLLFLAGRPTWIIYNFLVGSYAGLLTEAFIVTSLGIAIIRFDVLKKPEKI